MQRSRDRQVPALRRARFAPSNPVAKRDRHCGVDLRRAKSGRQKFRGIVNFGGNGPLLMPAKIPPRSSSWHLAARGRHEPEHTRRQLRSTVDPIMQLSTLTPTLPLARFPRTSSYVVQRGLLPSQADAVDDRSAQIAAVRRRCGEWVKSTHSRHSGHRSGLAASPRPSSSRKKFGCDHGRRGLASKPRSRPIRRCIPRQWRSTVRCCPNSPSTT